MGYKEGSSRYEISFMTESMARIIDRFVELCDFQEPGFKRSTSAMTGRPAYPRKEEGYIWTAM